MSILSAEDEHDIKVGTLPTLSVLLPTYNDRWRLGTQIEAIVPQLRPVDELVILVQAADGTQEFLRSRFRQENVRWVFGPDPLGVCQAYNLAASMARGTWVIGASGNDEWQAGTLNAWLDAATRWPEARVMCGFTHPFSRMKWLPGTGFCTPADLIFVRHAEGWKTHGAAVFLRRDVWGRGYVPEIEWMADHVQCLLLAMRWGCVDLHHYCSLVTNREGSYCHGHNTNELYNAAIRATRREAYSEEWADIREMVRLYDETTGWLKERT